MKRLLSAAVLAGLLLKLVLVLNARSIGTDGTHYVGIGMELLRGEVAEASRDLFPPLYPGALAAVYTLIGRGDTQNAAQYVEAAELSARLVSLFCGLLLAVPMYFLGRDLFGPRVAALTGCVVALHPTINHFSGEVRSETLGALLAVSAVWLGWRGFSQQRAVWYGAAGLLLGLAYVTRPELAGFAGLIFVWTLAAELARSGLQPKSFLRALFFGVVLMILFASVAIPYMHNLKEDTGSWQISRKSGLFYTGGPIGFLREKAIRLPEEIFDRFGRTFSYGLFPFFLVGLFYRRLIRRKWREESYLLLLILAFFMILPTGHGRFYFTICVLGVPFAVIGLLEVAHALSKAAARKSSTLYDKRLGRIVVGFLSVLLVADAIAAGKPINVKREAGKEAGIAIRSYVEEHKIAQFAVCSVNPDAAYYSGGQFIDIEDEPPKADPNESKYENFLDFLATQHKIVFLVIDTTHAQKKVPWLLEHIAKDPVQNLKWHEPIPNLARQSEVRIYRYTPVLKLHSSR